MTEPNVGGQPLDIDAQLLAMTPRERVDTLAQFARAAHAAWPDNPQKRSTDVVARELRRVLHIETEHDPLVAHEWGRALTAAGSQISNVIAHCRRRGDVDWEAIAVLLVNAIGFAGADLMDGK